MSAAAAAAATAPAAAPPKGGKKKILLIVALVVLLLGAAGGGGALVLMKKRAAAAAAAEEGEVDADASASRAKAHDPSHPPAFMPLEPFVVNLADREADRFAQVGITLELDESKSADLLKPYMPAIRDGILMILAHKSSAELLERSGKEKLASEIARAVVRPMGIEVEPPQDDAVHEGDAGKSEPKKKRRKSAEPESPVRRVLFSSFIIQ